MDEHHGYQRRKQRVAATLGATGVALAIGTGISVLVTLQTSGLLVAAMTLVLLAGVMIGGLPLLDRLDRTSTRTPVQQRAADPTRRVASAR